MLRFKKAGGAFLMLAVLAAFAVLVNYLPSPVNLPGNPGTVISGLLNPDWRPAANEKVLLTGRQEERPELKVTPDLSVLLSPVEGLPGHYGFAGI